jgi:hypothetical protein
MISRGRHVQNRRRECRTEVKFNKKVCIEAMYSHKQTEQLTGPRQENSNNGLEEIKDYQR